VDFDWDDANLEHIEAHNVTQEEAEEALTDPARIGLPVYNTSGETRYGSLGRTESGRILAVIFTIRNGRVRVVTAREGNPTEKRRNRRKGK
jgi:uncharacterized DUF497 family protein